MNAISWHTRVSDSDPSWHALPVPNLSEILNGPQWVVPDPHLNTLLSTVSAYRHARKFKQPISLENQGQRTTLIIHASIYKEDDFQRHPLDSGWSVSLGHIRHRFSSCAHSDCNATASDVTAASNSQQAHYHLV